MWLKKATESILGELISAQIDYAQSDDTNRTVAIICYQYKDEVEKLFNVCRSSSDSVFDLFEGNARSALVNHLRVNSKMYRINYLKEEYTRQILNVVSQSQSKNLKITFILTAIADHFHLTDFEKDSLYRHVMSAINGQSSRYDQLLSEGTIVSTALAIVLSESKSAISGGIWNVNKQDADLKNEIVNVMGNFVDQDKFQSLFQKCAPEILLIARWVSKYMPEKKPIDPMLRYQNSLELAFLKPFEGEAANVLLEYIRVIQSAYHGESLWYAPIFPIVQSSGYGKSKLISQLGRLGHYIVYVCLRAPESTGYPKMPSWVKMLTEKIKKAKDDKECEDIWINFFHDLIYSMIPNSHNKFDVSPKQFIDAQVKCDKDLYSAIPDTRERGPLYKSELCKKLRNLCEIGSEENRKVVVFAIDEASELFNLNSDVNPVYCWRRAIIELNNHIKVVGITIDTQSPIAALAPVNKFDPSLRVVNGQFIFPPFIWIPASIQNAESYLAEIRALNYAQLGSADGIPRLYELGRPLWKSLKEDNPQVQAKDILEAAEFKISGEYKQDMYAAIIALRTSMSVHESRFASRLVSSHMATLIGFTSARDYSVSCIYPPEPPMQHAANKIYVQNAKEIIESFADLVKELNIKPGTVGERLSKLILLQTMDKCRGLSGVTENWPQHMIKAVTVRAFIETLFGSCSKPIIAGMDDALLDGKINFTKFSLMQSRSEDFCNFGEDTIREALFLQTGISLFGTFPAIDLLIPVMLIDNACTVIMVQVKNEKNSSMPSSITSCLAASKSNSGYQRILNSLRLKIPSLAVRFLEDAMCQPLSSSWNYIRRQVLPLFFQVPISKIAK